MTTKARSSGDPTDGLLKSLLVLSRVVDHVLEKRAVEAATGAGLAVSKVKLLRLLAERGSQTSTRVARFLGVTKPAVSQIIDSLVHSRFVVRRRAKEDRREVYLELTKLGLSKYQGIRRAQRQVLRSAMQSAPGGSSKEWAKTLKEAAVALARVDAAYEDFCLQCSAHADNTCVLNGTDGECLFLQGKHRGE